MLLLNYLNTFLRSSEAERKVVNFRVGISKFPEGANSQALEKSGVLAYLGRRRSQVQILHA